MNNRKWVSWAIGASLLGSGLMGSAANALPPNQSDITGTNIWNNTAPIFEDGGGIDPEILAKARSLDQALAEAASLCPEAFSPTGPRRFSREPGNPNPGCMELKRLMEESRVFLEEVKRVGGEQANAGRSRIW